MDIALLTDFYEFTMANGFFRNKDLLTKQAVFDVFYRKNPDDAGFSICCGTKQVIDFLKNFSFNKNDIEYLKELDCFDKDFIDYLARNNFGNIKIQGIPEGTIVFPNEPILTVEAPLIFAQLVETEILNQFNHQMLIATKANRIKRAAQGKNIAEFGARRAHNNDAAIYGARAAYIGGVDSTSNCKA